MSSGSFTRLCTFYCKQSLNYNARFYSRWMHRKPARVFLPFEPTSNPNLKKEKVISLDSKIINRTSPLVETKDNVSKKHKKKAYKEEHSQNISIEEQKQNVSEDPLSSSEAISKAKKINTSKIKSQRQENLEKRKLYLSQSKVFDENNEIIYEKLKDNDGRISALLVQLKSKKTRLRQGQIFVEGWRLIVDGLQAKCRLNYIIFSQVDDLNKIRPFLPETGVKIYKIPYREIQLWSNVETSPGILGIFEIPTPENIKVPLKPLPLQFVCDNIRVPGNLGAILRAAVGVGCEKVFLSKGCVDLWDPKVVRSAAGSHFRLPIHHSMNFQEIENCIDEESSLFIADSNTTVMDEDMQREEKYYGMQIPVVPYYSVDFATLNKITLIIGGETEGISEDSYRFAKSRQGIRLNIPLEKGVDSLNTGMATAVIAFEIRKQLTQAWGKIKNEELDAQASV